MAAKVLHAETRVRKGRKGKWVAARQVRGLFASSGKSSPTSQESSTAGQTGNRSPNRPPMQRKAEAKQQKSLESDDGTYLTPIRSRKLRGIVYGCLVALVMIGTTPIWQKLFFALTVGLLIGSFPLTIVTRKAIEQTIIVFFYPVHRKRWPLRDFVAVMPSREPRITDSIGCLVIFFFWYWFLFRLFDYLIPWMGGNYTLYLKQFDDEKLLVWQGNNTHDFEANLELLESTGLPIE